MVLTTLLFVLVTQNIFQLSVIVQRRLARETCRESAANDMFEQLTCFVHS